MPSENENLIRTAYEAYSRGDLSQLLELVDPDLEWTYLDPAYENPEPQTCHGPAGAGVGPAGPVRPGTGLPA
jgi:ketosteroid isomerase-like protein